jgi:cell wall-associated NlpC family hydrolase
MLRLISILFITTILSYSNAEARTILYDGETTINSDALSLCDSLNLPNNKSANIELLRSILAWKGTPYCYGGSSKQCTDCSGFVGNIYKTVYGIALPRTSRDMHKGSKKLRKNKLTEGNLLFFSTRGGVNVSHVGIYLWEGYFVHASSKRGVTISNMNEGYYKKNFVSAGIWN